MRILGRVPRSSVFVGRQQSLEGLVLRAPVVVIALPFEVVFPRLKDARQSPPAHVLHKDGLFLARGWTLFLREILDNANRSEIAGVPFTDRSCANPICVRDAVEACA